jgi:hypothetical protein
MSTTDLSHQKHATVVLTFVVVLYIIFSVFNWAPLEEDAYIYFRFVDNIAAGHGYVFNPGGEKIEGCSSFTWLFMLVFFKLAGINTLLAAKCAGIALGCISLIVIYRISRTVIASPLLAVLPSLLTAFSVPYLLRNQMGLDEPVYTLVFLLLVFACLCERSFKFWPVLFFLLIISRPEGMVIGLAFLPVFYLYRDRRRDIAIGIAAVAVLTGALFLFRMLYFNDFLPSPFYFKVHPGKYNKGFLYAYDFLKSYYMYIVLIPVFCMLFKRGIINKQKAVLLSFACIHCLWIILAGACFFPFYRHFVPVIPLFYILALSLAVDFSQHSRLLRGRITAICLCCYGAAALFLPQANWAPWEKEPNYITHNITAFFQSPSEYMSLLMQRIADPRYDRDNTLDSQSLAGIFIRNNYLPGTTFLYDQMGRLPYNAGSHYMFRDTNGLIDKEIGRFVFTRRSRSGVVYRIYDKISQHITRYFFDDVRYFSTPAVLMDSIFEKNPDVLMCYVMMRNEVIRQIGDDSRFSDEYIPAYYMSGILFFERRGLLKKPFSNPDGIPVVFQDEVYRYIQDHPWAAVGE